MSEPILSARGLSKIYRLYDRPRDRLREVLLGRPCHRAFEALVDVTFELRRGEALGIVGENGAGKTTLLKLLAGVTVPTRGALEVRGTVASLLELGMGFHPEFTGRQNIRLNAATMGLDEATVTHKTPEIIEFSELGEFIDRPVKTYSTGMAMRLGFAIAAQVEPEILIVDEALSVGDGYFQKKCMDRIRELLDDGCTLLFCSHAHYTVASFCQRAIWLKSGRVMAQGPVDEVIRRYEGFLLEKRGKKAGRVEGRPAGSPAAKILGASLGRSEARYAHREPWQVEITWESESPEIAFHLGVGIDRLDGVQLCAFGTYHDDLPPCSGQQSYRAVLTLPELPVLQGEFSLNVFLLDEKAVHVYDKLSVERAFSVETDEFRVGLLEVEHHWRLPARASPQRPAALA